MTHIPEPCVQAMQWAVSCLPEGHPDQFSFTVFVEYRGAGMWVVRRGSFLYYADGSREYESTVRQWSDEAIATFRFDFDTAMEIAKKVAPTIGYKYASLEDALAFPYPEQEVQKNS